MNTRDLTIQKLRQLLAELEAERDAGVVSPIDLSQPGTLVQIRSDISDAYGGLPALVQSVRAGRAWCMPLVPHRGGNAWPYPPGMLLPLCTLPHPVQDNPWIRRKP